MAKANSGYAIYRIYRMTFDKEIAEQLVIAVNKLHENQLLSDAHKKAARNTSVDKNTRAQILNKYLREKIQGSEQFFRNMLAALDTKAFPIVQTMAKALEDRNPPHNRFGKKYTSGDSSSSYEHSTVSSAESSSVGSVKSQSTSKPIAPVQSQDRHYGETTPAIVASSKRRSSYGILEGTESIIVDHNSSEMVAEDIQRPPEYFKNKTVVLREVKLPYSPSLHRRSVGDLPRNTLSYELEHLDELDNAIDTSIKRVEGGCSEMRTGEQRIESGYKNAAEHYKRHNEQLQLEINQLKHTNDEVEYKKSMAVYEDADRLSQELKEKEKDIKRLNSELEKANADLVNIKMQLTVKKYAQQKGVESKRQLLQEIDDLFPQLQKLQGQKEILDVLHNLKKKALMLREDRPSTA